MGRLSIMAPATPLASAGRKLTITPTPTPVPFAATNLGIAANTIRGLIGNVPIDENPYLKVAKDIGQGIATRVASTGLSIMNVAAPKISAIIAPSGNPGVVAQPTIQIPDYLHPIFGADTNTISDVPTKAQAYAEKIKADPFAQKYGLDKIAVPLGYGLIAAGTALDLSGLGGEKGAIEALARETDPALVMNILRKIGIDQSVAEKFAPDIAVARTPSEVKSVLDIARASHGLSIISDAEKGNMPDLLHRGDNTTDIRPNAAGEISFSRNKQYATSFGNDLYGDEAVVNSVRLSPEAKILNVSALTPAEKADIIDGYSESGKLNEASISDYAHDEGYDAIDFSGLLGNKASEVKVLNRAMLSRTSPAKTAEEAVATYYKEVLAPAKESGQAQIIGADDLKDYFGNDYNIANHPVYSKAANDLLFKTAAEHDNPTVLMTAGGTGAGKSELIARQIAPHFDGVIYDSTLTNYDGAVRQIRDLREMGKNPEIIAAVRDPASAYNFTKLREAAGGHPVSEGAFIRSHSQVNDNLIRLIQEHDVPVKVFDLRGVTTPEQFKALTFAKDPLAVLEDSRYTEDNVRQTISKYQSDATLRANAGNEKGSVPAGGAARGSEARGSAPPGESGPILRSEERIGQFPAEAPFPTTPEGKVEEKLAKSDPTAQQAFDEPLGLPDKGPLGKSPGTALRELANGKDGKSWQSITRGYLANAPKAKTANIMSYLSTPEFELERLGLAKGAEMLQAAKDEAIDLRNEFLNKVISWKSEIDALKGDTAAANTRIFRYLDGKARFVTKDMSPEELRVAGEVKAWLKHLADRLNIPEESRISEYITHIFERTSEVNPQESIFDDPEMLAIMDQPAKSVYDPFLQARLGKPNYKEDTWGALDAYAKRAARKIAMDPALERVATDAKKLDGAAYQYVTAMTHNINMRPQHIDTLIDNFLKDTPGIGNRFGARPVAAITNTVRRVFSRGMYGLNFRNALNNLSQGANTYAKLGEKYTTIGYSKLLSRMLTGNLEDLYKSHVLEEQFVEQDKKLGVYKTALQRLDPKLFIMQRGSELINRGAAYYGAEARGLARGLSPEEAVKYAKRIVRETQFSFSAVDMPVGLNSDLAKTITQTQSYNVKQIEFLKRMVADKNLAGLVRYSLASLVFMQTIGKAYGLTIQQMLPTIGLGGNPYLAILTDISNLTFGTVQTKATALSDLKTRIAQLVPAGGQIKKTVAGLSAYAAGRDKTPTGKTRFVIPKTMENLLRAALFGKSGLPQAQKYYDKLDNPKKVQPAGTLSI